MLKEDPKSIKLMFKWDSYNTSLAIKKLLSSLKAKSRNNILLGVTGSGKTFTMASVIAELNKPALILSPNKVLAAQLYAEFKSFFP